MGESAVKLMGAGHRRYYLILSIMLTTASGQSFAIWNDRTHSELHWQVVSTDHFNIHYHQGLEALALKAAVIAEQVYPVIMAQLEVEDFGKTDVMFTSEDEIMNGFALPSRQIFIWVSQNNTVGRFTGNEKWLKTVIAHEFQHVAMIQALRTWYGTINLLAVPGWFIEGAAEYYTERWRVGRSDAKMKLHTYRNTMKRLNAHDQGYAKLLFMADKFGDSTITRIVHHRDSLKIGKRALFTLPYSFKKAFKKVTGESLKNFTEEWRRAMNTYYYTYRGQKESVAEVGEPVPIRKIKRVYGLAFSPDSSQIAIVGRRSDNMGDMGLYVVDTDSTGKVREIHFGNFEGHPSWSPDGKQIAVNEYHRGAHGSLTYDIRIVDVVSGAATWLTHNERTTAPAWSPVAHEIIYASHPELTTNLYLTDLAANKTTAVTDYEGDVQIQSPSWSPDGKQIAFSIQEEDGMVDIAVINRDGTGYRRLTHDAGTDLAPVWSTDGQQVIFTSYRNGTANLYRIALADSLIIAMTDVAEGISARQMMPGDTSLIAMTLADVDTTRIRLVPLGRTVDADTVVIRPQYNLWRTGQPTIPMPEIDYGKIPEISNPEPFKSRGTWRPIFNLLIPYGYGATGVGIWTDGIGKQQLMGGIDYNIDTGLSAELLYVNNNHAPSILAAFYRRAKLRLRGYGDGYLVEEMSGLELGGTLPFNLGESLASNHRLSASIRAFQRVPFDDQLESPLRTPAAVNEGGISIIYSWKYQRPHRTSNYFPKHGMGARLRLDHYTTAIYGDVDYGKGEAEFFMHQRLGSSLAIFGRVIGTTLYGTPPQHDRTGLMAAPPVYLNDGSIGALLGDVLETVEIHSLRGMPTSTISTSAWSGTLELRAPLADKLPINLFGYGLGQVTVALFTDFGQAVGKTDLLYSYGSELKVNLIIGNLPILTFAVGQAFWPENEVAIETEYFRLGLMSPF